MTALLPQLSVLSFCFSVLALRGIAVAKRAAPVEARFREGHGLSRADQLANIEGFSPRWPVFEAFLAILLKDDSLIAVQQNAVFHMPANGPRQDNFFQVAAFL